MTNVLFLLEADNSGDVFAFFPDIDSGDGFNTSYSSIGQHSACSADYANECQEAEWSQYLALKNELGLIGYDNLNVLNRSK